MTIRTDIPNSFISSFTDEFMRLNAFLIGSAMFFGMPICFAAESTQQLNVRVKPLMNGSVPQGASRVAMLTLDLTAPCQTDVRLKSMRISHIGLGDASNISGVYALQGIARISNSVKRRAIHPTAFEHQKPRR